MIQPTRKGRFHEIDDWKEQYRRKRTATEDVVKLVRNGDVIASCGGANFPQAFAGELGRYAAENNIRASWFSPFLIDRPSFADIPGRPISMYSYFFGEERTLLQPDTEQMEFIPINLSEAGACIAARKPRVIVAACTPPDENGWMSRSLWGAHMDRRNIEDPSCEILVAEINEKLPRLHSEGEGHLNIHVSEVDYITENAYEWCEIHPVEPTETDKTIAGYVAELIPDGACIQIGLGGLSDAVGNLLRYAGKQHLGLHTEILSNCIAGLMEDGIIDNSRKTVVPGRSVASQIVGDRHLWEFVDHNTDLEIREIGWVNDLRVIAQNDNTISVNNALEIDLTGQVASEAIGPRQYSGTGGQLEWVMGSQMSKNGKSIITIHSTYTDKQGNTQSKIRRSLVPGSIVTTPRQCVNYVATEYGIVDLRYKSTLERAKALISIAHPDFREELKKEIGSVVYGR